ncbi:MULTISPECIES: helix-turn-helix transcriptional regulator [Staphylococcus intermedius group]|uniref:helix-turn-helix transcriptional regulator n=1 Tax=Staphylococcus intermedius group TaxID=2815305 RepID=UPI0012D31F4A|nr:MULTISPECIES: helix-turn-helix transcriptional regulator [Staphylococcus intermedius group]MBJ8269008.1 helix-turn-helix transcriptional regulator [Staphylococcus pseudintermedius]MTV23510.1 helix-turn-helix domain-containing protein [Staphylococcus delphini]
MRVTLKELRKKHNITQTELSLKTNISRQTINMLENNSYIPSLKTAKKLALFFNTSIECIFLFEEGDL